MGLKVIGFADHFWDETIPGASGGFEELNFKHVMSIKEMLPDEKNALKVLVGCETEYRGNGNIAISSQVAERFDFVLVPTSHVHFESVRPPGVKTAKDIAKLMVTHFKEVLEFDFITGMAHPFLPIGFLNRNEILSFISDEEFAECFSIAAEKNVSIEITTGYFPSIRGRTQTPEYNDETYLRMLKIAKQEKCLFHFASDSHELSSLEGIVKMKKILEDLGFIEEDLHPLVRDAALDSKQGIY